MQPGSDQVPSSAKIWYFNIGEQPQDYDDGTNRSWDDNRKFGFVSAGRSAKSAREIMRVRAGDFIYAYLNTAGYVGYGKAVTDAVPARDLVLADQLRLADAPLQQKSVIEYEDVSVDSREYACAVDWIRTVSRNEAKTFRGIYYFRGATTELSDPKTLRFLSQEIGDGNAPQLAAPDPHVWIEKTLVANRPDRQSGEHAMGAALWSPLKSKGGADIYRFMRDVSPGDVVLHFTDNHGFTGISQAAGPASEFSPPDGTEWEGELSQRVPLENFVALQPPLDREVLFAGGYRDRLLALISSGQKNLFYNRAGSLNQGAYLTPAPPALVRILNDAYQALAGRPLVDNFDVGSSEPLSTAAEDAAAFNELVELTSWSETSLSTIISAIRHPTKPARQIIFAGPPGTSKTFVAQLLVNYLTKGDSSRGHVVQFHPSYSYEQFIEGLRPTIVDGAVQFKAVNGVVLEIAEQCRETGLDHFLIIDELNRANLPRVLGELMYLFEYRDKEIDLPYTRKFSLPPNLYFIATMNTADRNIRSIDIALRRRFDVFDCPADEGILRRFYELDANRNDVPDLVDGFIKLNFNLTQYLDEHHTIGHAFFMAKHFTSDDLEAIWSRKIQPLLNEYFFASPDIAKTFVATEFWPSLLDSE